MSLPRRRTAELMDRSDAEPRELSRSLEDLRRVNLWLGGRRTAVRLVLGLAAKVPISPVSVLDVGTGAADIPIALVRQARKIGLALAVTATDLHATTLEFARKQVTPYPEIDVAPADLLDLPYRIGSRDIVMCHTTLHHFSREEALQALREMDRVARYGIVVTDLARSRAALLGAFALAATAWRTHPITRHDGPASVRAAFTPGEIHELAREIFDRSPRVRRHPLFRLSLVVDRMVAGERSPR